MSERPKHFRATRSALSKICEIVNEYQGQVFVEEERKRADALALQLATKAEHLDQALKDAVRWMKKYYDLRDTIKASLNSTLSLELQACRVSEVMKHTTEELSDEKPHINLVLSDAEWNKLEGGKIGMSYSVCVVCKRMVSMYEKLCGECAERFPGEQDMGYHKTHSYAEADMEGERLAARPPQKEE